MGREGSSLTNQWISIWDIACQHHPEKPRYYASRLLNYAILSDLPRKVGDVSNAVAGDVERLYNIAVNSPNVDKISREVLLSASIVESHIDGRRFDPDERYLPRRPRHEEYLLAKPAQPFHFIPVDESAEADPRLSYFARMAIPYAVHKPSGQPVTLDYRDNLIVDKELPQIKSQAKKKRFKDSQLIMPPEVTEMPSRLGSLFSSEALLWNVFRSMLRADGFHHFLAAKSINRPGEPIGGEERISAAWFWGMNDRGSDFPPMTQASDAMGEAADNRTRPDLLLLGINHFYLVESTFATTFPACPLLKREQCPGTEGCNYWAGDHGITRLLPNFRRRHDLQKTCGRHYQLTRLFLLLRGMANSPSLRDGRVVCIVDDHGETGQLNIKLFNDFCRNLEPEEMGLLTLTSWQKIAQSIPRTPDFEELHREFREKWNF